MLVDFQITYTLPRTPIRRNSKLQDQPGAHKKKQRLEMTRYKSTIAKFTEIVYQAQKKD